MASIGFTFLKALVKGGFHTNTNLTNCEERNMLEEHFACPWVK